MKNYFSNKGTIYLVAAFLAVLAISIGSGPNVHANNTRTKKRNQLAAKKSLGNVLKKKMIDLDFDKTDIRDILDYIAKQAKTNICFYEREGEEQSDYLVTISLTNISALGALKVLTRVKGLGYYIDEHVVWVSKSDQLKDLMDLVTKIYSPRSGNIESLKEIIENLLSEKGKTAVDKQLNIIVVTDTEDVIRTIDSACRALRHNIGPEIVH